MYNWIAILYNSLKFAVKPLDRLIDIQKEALLYWQELKMIFIIQNLISLFEFSNVIYNIKITFISKQNMRFRCQSKLTQSIACIALNNQSSIQWLNHDSLHTIDLHVSLRFADILKHSRICLKNPECSGSWCRNGKQNHN